MPPETLTPDAPATTQADPADALLARLFESATDTPPEPENKPAGDEPKPEPERSRTLHEALADTTPIPAKKEEPKAEEKKPEATKPAEPAPVAEKPIRKRQRAAAPAEPPPPPPVVPAVEQAAPAAKAPPPADEEWEKSLLDEERDQLEAARFAERRFPEKYKGLGAKVEKFLKEHAAKVNAPDFQADDPSYQSWLQKNRPTLSQAEIRTIERERLRDELRPEIDERTNQVRDELFRTTHEPQIKRRADDFFAAAVREALPADVLKGLTDPARGVKWARENYPLEVEIAENIAKTAADDIEVFARLTTANPATGRPFEPYDKDNEAHRRVIALVKEVCEEYKTATANRPERIRDGKAYATRLEFARLPPEQRAKYWTLSDNEIVAIARAKVKHAATRAIEQERTRIARYTKRPASEAPAAQQDAPPPAPRPSPLTSSNADTSPSAVDKFVTESLFGKPVE